MSRQSEYGAVEWLRSHRVGLGPVYLGVPVLIAGVVAHLFLSGLQTLLAVAVLLFAGFTVSGRRPGQRARRVYFAVVTVLTCAWIVAADLVPDSTGAWTWLLFSLVVGGVLAAIPWWTDQLKRTHVKLEHVLRSWPTRAQRIQLGDVVLTGVKNTPIGWAGKFKWLPGAHTVDDVLSRQGQIEGALGLQSGQLRMPLDGKSTNSVNVIVVLKDPHATSIPWEIPTDEVNDQTVLRHQKISDGAEFGVREDGVRRRVKLFTKGWGAHQILIAGIKGSGKSVLLNLIWAFCAVCTDCVQWGIDLKGGMELGPWRSAFDWVVSTYDDALLMVMCAEAIVDRRAEHCAKVGWKVWQPSAENPVLVLSMDEVASLLGKAKSADLDRVAELARKGRAVGVVIIMATQYPTLDALGSNQIRQQIDQRFCFRMQDGRGEDYVITAGTVNAHKIDSDRPGTCYWQDGDKLDLMPYRTLYISDETIAQVVSLVAGYTPSLDGVSVGAAQSIVTDETDEGPSRYPYDERDIFVPEQRDTETAENETTESDEDGTEMTENETDDGTENENETVPPFETADVSLKELGARRLAALSEPEREAARLARDAALREPERLSEEAAAAMFVQALREAGSEGIEGRLLREKCTRGSTWVHDKLEPMLAEEMVVRTKRGRYAWAAFVDSV